MSKVFKHYASIYDLIYLKKNYAAECAYLKRIFSRYACGRVKSVLDLACGTGNHALCLARQGFEVYAQDASIQMLALAKRKARKAHLPIKFTGCHPMQDFSHNTAFDAVIAMFSSIDYLTLSCELKSAFNNVRRCLRPGGVFIFDFWNRDCVLREYSPLKTIIFEQDGRKVLRISETTISRVKAIANIHYTCYYFEGGRRKAFIEEQHKMKYYRINDMVAIVEKCGFKVLGCFPFMKIGFKIGSCDWNISLVATPRLL